MKLLTKRLSALIVLLALVLCPFVASAQDAASADADKKEVVTVTGIINHDQDQLVLDSGTETYQVNTDVDEALIGKKVVATGVVVDNDGEKEFEVQTVKPVE